VNGQTLESLSCETEDTAADEPKQPGETADTAADEPIQFTNSASTPNDISGAETTIAESIPSSNDISYLDQFAFDGPAPAAKPLAFSANANASLSQEQLQEIPRSAVGAPIFPQQPAESGKKQRSDALEDFNTMSETERDQVSRKWWNFVEDGSDGEIAKLQLLVAAILHAKATEASVRNSLQSLRSWADHATSDDPEAPRGLTVEKLANATVAELVPRLEGLHWHKVKASRIIAAAKELLRRYEGNVPTDKESLMRVPGLGPKLANVLNFVLQVTQLPVESMNATGEN